MGKVLHLLSCSGKSRVRQTQLFLETLQYNSSYRGSQLFFSLSLSLNMKSFNLLKGRVNPQKDRMNLRLIMPHMWSSTPSSSSLWFWGNGGAESFFFFPFYHRFELHDATLISIRLSWQTNFRFLFPEISIFRISSAFLILFLLFCVADAWHYISALLEAPQWLPDIIMILYICLLGSPKNYW